MAEEVNIDDLMYFNGIDALTGEYDRPPMSNEELWRIVKGEEADADLLDELRFRYESSRVGHFGIREGLDPKKLEQSGWGVIFASDADPAVKEALSELLALREKQAGKHYRLYDGSEGHREGESKSQFLARHGAGPGPADPEKVPYYLLIVGSPDRIPYRFQSQLDVQYAVGRIDFDTLDEYANYAASVVKAESGEVKLPRTANFFGVANPDDQATTLSARYLVEPLYEKFKAEASGWEVSSFMRDQATRKQLSAILGGEQTPSFLFTASHGASFPIDSNLQRNHNGALICQDWPGPLEWPKGQPLDPNEHYFSGDYLSSDRNLLGLIAFFFACYGGGTPRKDEFSAQAFRDSRREIAKNNFVAHLPNQMLSLPKGGALAVIGHVERAWGYSFVWPKAGKQLAVFEDTIKRLMDGHPVGSAVEYFNERYAELSTVLSDELEEIKFGDKRENPYELAGMWTANNDARGYAIIGDPAVRLPVVGEGEEATERPVIEASFQPVLAEAEAEQEAPESGESEGPESDSYEELRSSMESESDRYADFSFSPSPRLYTSGVGRAQLEPLEKSRSTALSTFETLRLYSAKIAKEAKRSNLYASLAQVTLIILGAVAATSGTATQIFGDSNLVLLTYTLVGLVIAAVGGLSSSFKWGSLATERRLLSGEVNSMALEMETSFTDSIREAESSAQMTDEDGEQRFEEALDSARQIHTETVRYMRQVHKRAAELGINLVHDVKLS